MDLDNLQSFLSFGYFLKYKNPRSKYLFTVDELKYKGLSEQELIQKGADVFRKNIENNFKDNSKHVIPLSGGLDSRALLFALKEFTSLDNISTYTYGTPRTLDYDLGKKVASKFNIRHHQFPLNSINYSEEELINTSKRIDHQTLLFHHQPLWLTDELFNGQLVWSGFNGGTFTDNYVEKFNSNSVVEGKENFITKNRFVNSVSLVTTNYSKSSYIELPETIDDHISIDMIIDAYNRQLKYIEPHVLVQGYEYVTPFMNNEWDEFFLSIDKRYRINQYLYIKILDYLFPDFFDLPDKKNKGIARNSSIIETYFQRFRLFNKQIVNRIVPSYPRYDVNYIDFNRRLRNNKYLKRIVRESIFDLHKRNILNWINIEEIWNNHMYKKENHGDALITMASLEIHIKAGKIL